MHDHNEAGGAATSPRRARRSSRWLWLALGVVGVLAAIFAFGTFGSIERARPFEGVCHSVARADRAEDCMFEVGRDYRGPDDDTYRRNAAAQWARDNGAEREPD